MKTIPFPQFLSKDSVPFSSKADCQILMNLYRETIQSGDGENPSALYKTPGLAQKAIFETGRHRGLFELNDHLFDASGGVVYDLDAAFTVTNTYSPLANDGRPVIFAADTTTLLVVSAGVLHRLSGTLTLPVTPAPPISVAQIDTYFVMLSAQNQIFWSPDSGITWDPLDFQTIEALPNKIIAMIVDHNELWLIGNRITQVYTVGTDPNTPFVPRQDAVIQQGIAAPHSLVALHNGLLWLGRNKNGERTIVKTQGFNPGDPVSTYAVANAIRKFPVVDDCVGMAFQINGHDHVWFTFPSAPGLDPNFQPVGNGLGQTLGYDATEDDWYRVGFWNVAMGRYERHRANCLASAFGIILAGDHETGQLYELSPDYYDDAGAPIRWVRRAPHITQMNRNVQIGRFEVVAEAGVGLDG